MFKNFVKTNTCWERQLGLIVLVFSFTVSLLFRSELVFSQQPQPEDIESTSQSSTAASTTSTSTSTIPSSPITPFNFGTKLFTNPFALKDHLQKKITNSLHSTLNTTVMPLLNWAAPTLEQIPVLGAALEHFDLLPKPELPPVEQLLQLIVDKTDDAKAREILKSMSKEQMHLFKDIYGNNLLSLSLNRSSPLSLEILPSMDDVEINHRDQIGNSPLLRSILDKNFLLAQKLIERKAQVNVINKYGENPFSSLLNALDKMEGTQKENVLTLLTSLMQLLEEKAERPIFKINVLIVHAQELKLSTIVDQLKKIEQKYQHILPVQNFAEYEMRIKLNYYSDAYFSLQNCAFIGGNWGEEEYWDTKNPDCWKFNESKIDKFVKEDNGARTFYSKSEVSFLPHAKIAYANYSLLRQDFPHLSTMSELDIDQWVLQNAAYMEKKQVTQTEVNTAIIAEEGSLKHAYRPVTYDRALILPVPTPTGERLLDVKGAGGLNPTHGDHSNGLASLGDCLREHLFAETVEKFFKHAGAPERTVGTYAIIDTGFNIKNKIHKSLDANGGKDGKASEDSEKKQEELETFDEVPAGLYVRQAHTRNLRQVGFLTNIDIGRLSEFLATRYGVNVEENVQGTLSGDLFDFGHFVFSSGKSTLRRDCLFKLPTETWGYDSFLQKPDNYARWFFAAHDFPTQFSHEAAKSYRCEGQNRDIITRHIEQMLNVVDLALKH